MVPEEGRCSPRRQPNSSSIDADASKAVVDGEDPNDNGECAGLIFLCNHSTKMDCFKYRVFGLSKNKKNLMGMLVEGMPLFLFDVEHKVMHGVYAASSCGGFNLEPEAFGGDFPWQVKFQIEKDCAPLPEEVFKAAIKDNYFSTTKFKRELTPQQVQKLVELFRPLPQEDASTVNGPRSPGLLVRTVASSKETCRHAHNGCLEGTLPYSTTSHTADEPIKSSSPESIQYKPRHVLSDEVSIGNCTHDHCMLRSVQTLHQCIPACKTCCTSHVLMDSCPSSWESIPPVKDAATGSCICGFCALKVHHEHISSDTERDPFTPRVQEECIYVVDKSGLMAKKAHLSHGHDVCESSAYLCTCMQSHFLLPPRQKILCDKNFQSGPLVESSPVCQLACFPVKGLFNGAVSYSLYGHGCKAGGCKRPYQEMAVYTPGGAAREYL